MTIPFGTIPFGTVPFGRERLPYRVKSEERRAKSEERWLGTIRGVLRSLVSAQLFYQYSYWYYHYYKEKEKEAYQCRTRSEFVRCFRKDAVYSRESLPIIYNVDARFYEPPLPLSRKVSVILLILSLNDRTSAVRKQRSLPLCLFTLYRLGLSRLGVELTWEGENDKILKKSCGALDYSRHAIYCIDASLYGSVVVYTKYFLAILYFVMLRVCRLLKNTWFHGLFRPGYRICIVSDILGTDRLSLWPSELIVLTFEQPCTKQSTQTTQSILRRLNYDTW